MLLFKYGRLCSLVSVQQGLVASICIVVAVS